MTSPGPAALLGVVVSGRLTCDIRPGSLESLSPRTRQAGGAPRPSLDPRLRDRRLRRRYPRIRIGPHSGMRGFQPPFNPCPWRAHLISGPAVRRRGPACSGALSLLP